MEAMVASDNVVRGGLTPKFKDTKTLVEVSLFQNIFVNFFDQIFFADVKIRI